MTKNYSHDWPSRVLTSTNSEQWSAMSDKQKLAKTNERKHGNAMEK
jgi:hypothetical protein